MSVKFERHLIIDSIEMKIKVINNNKFYEIGTEEIS